MVKASGVKEIRDLPTIIKPTNTMCRECVMGKQIKNNFQGKSFLAREKLDLVHIDLCGPTKTRAYHGERYFILFIDDYSKMMWVTFLREKLEAFDKFKIFKAKLENESGTRIKCLRSNRGGEFTSDSFNNYCEVHIIHRKTSTPRTP
jgi:hypothetical protein